MVQVLLGTAWQMYGALVAAIPTAAPASPIIPLGEN